MTDDPIVNALCLFCFRNTVKNIQYADTEVEKLIQEFPSEHANKPLLEQFSSLERAKKKGKISIIQELEFMDDALEAWILAVANDILEAPARKKKKLQRLVRAARFIAVALYFALHVEWDNLKRIKKEDK